MRMIVQPNFYPWFKEVIEEGLRDTFSKHRVKRTNVAWRFMIDPQNAGNVQIWIIQIGDDVLPLGFIEDVQWWIPRFEALAKGKYRVQVLFDRTGYREEEIERDNKRWNTYREEFEVVT